MRINRKARSIIVIVAATVATLASFAAAPSLASWTQTNYDNGPVSALDCAAGGLLNTTASGQLIAGEVAGTFLSGHLADAAALTATTAAPATSSAPSGATPDTSIGGDAWTSTLDVQALSNINIAPSIPLPLNSALAVATQYARATSGGIATGASGAVNGGSGGTVSFQTTSPLVPTLPSTGTLDLATALSSVVGSQLSSDVTQLSDASLSVGALGSITDEENGCQNIWQGIQNSAASVARSYILAGLELNLRSSLVNAITTDAASSVSALGNTLNLLEPTGTVLNTTKVDPATGSSLTGALASLLNVTLLPGVTAGVDGVPSVTIGVTFDLSSVTSLLTSTISSGGVSINLGNGTVSIDLAQLLGKTDLNGLPANSPLLTSANIASMAGGITASIGTLVNTTVNNAIKTLITAATVAITINTDVGIKVGALNVDALHANVGLTGTLGDFIDEAHNQAPTVGVNIAVLPAASALSSVLNVNTLLTPLTNTLTAGVLTSTLPILDDLVLNTVNTTAHSELSDALTALDGAPIGRIEASFGTLLGVVKNAVSITVNAQPDQSGGVGTPDDSSMPGRFFDSALVVGVLGANGISTLGLYFGSSSAGPVSLR